MAITGQKRTLDVKKLLAGVGQRLHDMAVLGDRDPVLKINGATSRALSVAIPDVIRKRAVIVE
jgi:hypothetical protein